MGHAFSPRLGAVALVAALALAGCGRKGPLELPPGAPQTQSPAATNAEDARVLPNQPDPGLIQPPNKTTQATPSEKLDKAVANPEPSINGAAATKPAKSLFLDPLL